MIDPAPSAQPVSDDEVVRYFIFQTIAYGGALALVLLLGVFVLFPDGVVSALGAAIGLALGLLSWFASRWIIASGLTRAGRRGRDDASGPGIVRAAVNLGIAFADVPAVVSLVIAFVLGSDIGTFVVAIPMAIAAIVVNASGPGAVRRHLATLRG